MSEVNHRDIQFGGPATYRIVVDGNLESKWVGRLANMVISDSGEEGDQFTVLNGRIKDQADLKGVLDTLHDLGLQIVEVETIRDSG